MNNIIEQEVMGVSGEAANPENSAQKELVAGSGVAASLEKEMERRFLQYSMSVIVSRALPDVRDGLKPCQRWISYAMRKKKMGSSGKTIKSGKNRGEVIGN